MFQASYSPENLKLDWKETDVLKNVESTLSYVAYVAEHNNITTTLSNSKAESENTFSNWIREATQSDKVIRKKFAAALTHLFQLELNLRTKNFKNVQ